MPSRLISAEHSAVISFGVSAAPVVARRGYADGTAVLATPLAPVATSPPRRASQSRAFQNLLDQIVDQIKLLLDLGESCQLGIELLPQLAELIFNDGDNVGAGWCCTRWPHWSSLAGCSSCATRTRRAGPATFTFRAPLAAQPPLRCRHQRILI